MKNFIFKLKKKLPLILTCVSAGGVVATGYFSARAQRKNDLKKIERFERGEEYPFLERFKNYILPITIGGITIACVFASYLLDKKQQAALFAALLASERTANSLREKIMEKYGEEEAKRIFDEAEKELRESEYPNDDLIWFYEPISKTRFYATESQVLRAQLDLNMKFHETGEACLNDFLMFCYQPPVDEVDSKGWTWDYAIDSGYSFIDCWHRKMTTDDGLECWELYFPFPPTEIL